MKYIVFCIQFFISSFNISAQDTTGVLKGQIFMPQIKKEMCNFRGRMYRNRLSAKQKGNDDNQTLKSSFIDVIVILNPLSFKVDTEPLEDVKIIQRNGKFIPRVVPVTRNTVVEFIN